MKKVLIFVLSLVCIFATALCFVSCSDNDNAGGGTPHAHTATAVAEKVATCTEGGYSAHYKCSCGKLFSDALATTEISLSEISTPADLQNHTKINFNAEVLGTCVTQGTLAHYSCESCSKLFSDENCSNEIFIDSINSGYGAHKNVSHTNETPSTCMTFGTYEHWYCTDCNQYSKDELFSFIVSEYELQKTEYGKCVNLTKRNGVKGNCQTVGTADYYECLSCYNLYLDENAEMPTYPGSPELETGYDFSVHTSLNIVYGTPADCRNEGVKDYYECHGCYNKYLDENCTQQVFDYSDLYLAKESHQMTHYLEQKPSCQNGYTGNYEYWYCSTCYLNYSDQEGYSEIYDLAIPGSEYDFASHVEIEFFDFKQPTCFENGHAAHYKCSCGVYFDEDKNYYGDDEYHFTSGYEMNEDHLIINLPAKQADCLNGNIECYTCEYCHKYFQLNDGSGVDFGEYIQIDESQAIIPATGRHSIISHEKIAPTCTESGVSEYFKCTTCKKYFYDEDGMTERDVSSLILEPLKHSWENHDYKASTCLEHGNISYSHCKNCSKDYNLLTNEEVTGKTQLPLGDHQLSFIEGYDATCEETGVLDSYYCSVCKNNFDKNNNLLSSLTISAKGHTFDTSKWNSDATHHWHDALCGHEVKGDFTEHANAERITANSTCKEQGEKEIYCPTCNTVTATEKLPFAEHNYKLISKVNSTCKTQGTLAHYKCTTCNELFLLENSKYVSVTAENLIIEINPDAHKYGAWHTITSATCQNFGLAERTCTLCLNREEHVLNMLSCDYQYVNVDAYFHSFECIYCHTSSSTGYHSLNEQFTCTTCNHHFDYTSGLIFSVYDNYATLTGAVNVSGDVKIPAMYGSAIVSAISSNVFKDNVAITSVSIPETVTQIGESAFNGCTALTAVYFEGTSQCKEIQKYAFYGCSKLSDCAIPTTIQKVREYAFSGSGITSVSFTNLTILEAHSFENCKSLVSVNIADSCSKIVTISDKTFYECKSLESVVLPKSLININGHAFYNCTSLGNITLPDGLLYIQESAFQNAFKEGTSLIIPESVEVINTSAFAGTSLKEVTINGLQSFKDNPSAVKDNNYLFHYSRKLEKVTLGENVDAILPYMFYCCYELKTLIIENQSNIAYIGDEAFKGTNIQNYNLTLSANLQYLGANFAAQSDSPYNSAYVQPTFNITFADASALSVCRNLGTNRYEKVCTEITATYWAETGYNLVAKSYYYVASETYLNG